MLCPLCSAESQRRFQKHGYWFRDCLRCGHRFTEIVAGAEHVQSVYGDDYFHGGGSGYADYLAEAELHRRRGRNYARLLKGRMKTGRVLDVGAAAGSFLAGFADAGWQCTGVEPNDAMANHARSVLGLDVRTGAAELFQPAEPFDLVCFSQVVAHFADPKAIFQQALTWTKPGGCWLIETWDRKSLMATALGSGWHEYSPPSVLHCFSRRGLRQFLGEFGMKSIAGGKLLKWIDVGHAGSLVAASGESSLFTKVVCFGLRFVPKGLALPYLSDDLFWEVFRRD